MQLDTIPKRRIYFKNSSITDTYCYIKNKFKYYIEAFDENYEIIDDDIFNEKITFAVTLDKSQKIYLKNTINLQKYFNIIIKNGGLDISFNNINCIV